MATLRAITVVLALLALCLAPLNYLVTQDNPDQIILTEGTAINVVTAHDVTSKEAKPNDPVNFTVNEDLVINGHVIVRKGTNAVGSVITAEKGGWLG